MIIVVVIVIVVTMSQPLQHSHRYHHHHHHRGGGLSYGIKRSSVGFIKYCTTVTFILVSPFRRNHPHPHHRKPHDPRILCTGTIIISSWWPIVPTVFGINIPQSNLTFVGPYGPLYRHSCPVGPMKSNCMSSSTTTSTTTIMMIIIRIRLHHHFTFSKRTRYE